MTQTKSEWLDLPAAQKKKKKQHLGPTEVMDWIYQTINVLVFRAWTLSVL